MPTRCRPPGSCWTAGPKPSARCITSRSARRRSSRWTSRAIVSSRRATFRRRRSRWPTPPPPPPPRGGGKSFLAGLSERVRELAVVERVVEAAAAEQLGVAPHFDDPALVHHDNAVGIADRRQPARNDEARPSPPQ